MWRFSPSLRKDSPLCSCFSSHSSPVILSGTCYRSCLWVLNCAVVFHCVVSCFGQYWSSSFFRFWLMLGTTSRWVGSEFICLWCCLPLVDLPSIVSTRLDFQDLFFGDLTSMLFFIARGWLHGLLILFHLLFYLCSLILLYLSFLLTSLVALFSPYLLL